MPAREPVLIVLLNLEPAFGRLLAMRVVTSLACPGDFCKCRLRSRLGSRGRLTQQLFCGHLYILRELDGVGGALLREEYLDLLEERLQLLATASHRLLVPVFEGLLHV